MLWSHGESEDRKLEAQPSLSTLGPVMPKMKGG